MEIDLHPANLATDPRQTYLYQNTYQPPFNDINPAGVGPTVPGSIFREGVPDDIDPTHVLIGSGSYYVTTPHEQAKYIVVIAIAVVIILVLMIFAFGFYWSGETANVVVIVPDPIDYPPAPINTLGLFQGRGLNQETAYTNRFAGKTINSEIICAGTGTAQWSSIASACRCNQPYWGGSCERESFKPQYIGGGTVTDETVTLAILAEYDTANLSYPVTTGDISCTDYCDTTTGCLGVKWDSEGAGTGGHCTLFSSATLNAGESFVFNPNVDANIYFQENLNAIRFVDKVLIYTGNLVPRWWIEPGVGAGATSTGAGYMLMQSGTRYSLSFYPLQVYNTTGMTGLFSLRPFDIVEFDTIVAGGNTDIYYINPPGSPLNLPLTWSELPIWAMYDVFV